MPTTTHPLAALCALALGAVSGVGAQALPPECTAVLERTSDQAIEYPLRFGGPEWFGLDTVLPILRSRSGHAPLAVPDSIATAWRADSSDIEWALASMVVSDLKWNYLMAEEAAQAYRGFSGRPRPILTALVNTYNDSRVTLVLGAIASAPDDLDQDIILSLACDAAWRLTAFRTDRKYSRRWVTSRLWNAWPRDDRQRIVTALRLLSGKRKAVASRLLEGISKDVPGQ